MASQESIEKLNAIFVANNLEMVIIRNDDDVFEFGYSYKGKRLKGSYTLIGGLDGLFPDEWNDFHRTLKYISKHKEYKN